jgi:hypothetical protein
MILPFISIWLAACPRAMSHLYSQSTQTPLTYSSERQPHTESRQVGLDFTLNEVTLFRDYRPSLAGQHMTISIKEDLFDTTDLDFHQRIVAMENASAFRDPHATNMATIAAGAGNSAPTSKGVAWKAWLSSSDFYILLPDADTYFLDHHITVQNHSYGTGIENYYDIEPLAYDEQVQKLPHIMHVFSAGNAGQGTPVDGTYAGLTGWANLTGQFKQSKNTLCVGATDSLDVVLISSSSGPAYDGRIKPEIVAFGLGGSSGAAALVSGLCLLLQESYESHLGTIPSSSLLRAVLVASAKDISTPGPDYRSGFGSLRAWQAVQIIEKEQFFTGEMEDGEIIQLVVDVPPSTSLLKVALAWNDAPGALLGEKALINDLDLGIERMISSEQWLPWTLSTFPHPDSLAFPSRRGIDTINNIEMVSLELPQEGNYRITITGNNIRQGPQPFSVAWQMNPASLFYWSFPSGSDYLIPDHPSYIRWNTSSTEEGVIAYQNLSDGQWVNIAGSIPPLVEKWEWKTPSEPGTYLLRWMEDDTTIYSDTFMIADPVMPVTEFICEDSMLMRWNTNGADSFTVLKLTGSHLEPFTTTSDTFIIDHAVSDPGLYAVTSYFDGSQGAPSDGIDLTIQDAGCYITSFFLHQINGDQAVFTIHLGSLYQVNEVYLERMIGQDYQAVAILSPAGENEFLMTSDPLNQGINYYRIRIIMSDGSSMLSDVEKVYFLREDHLLAFPNPVNGEGVIHVLTTKQQDFKLAIYNIAGQEIFSINGASSTEMIDVSGWTPGLYIIQIRFADGSYDATFFSKP